MLVFIITTVGFQGMLLSMIFIHEVICGIHQNHVNTLSVHRKDEVSKAEQLGAQ